MPSNPEMLKQSWSQLNLKESWLFTHIAQTIMNYPVPWFGYDGKAPDGGRKTVTLTAVIGWLDTGLTGIMAGIRANGAKLDGLTAAVRALGEKQGVDPAELERLIDEAVSRAADKHLSDIGTYELKKVAE